MCSENHTRPVAAVDSRMTTSAECPTHNQKVTRKCLKYDKSATHTQLLTERERERERERLTQLLSQAPVGVHQTAPS